MKDPCFRGFGTVAAPFSIFVAASLLLLNLIAFVAGHASVAHAFDSPPGSAAVQSDITPPQASPQTPSALERLDVGVKSAVITQALGQSTERSGGTLPYDEHMEILSDSETKFINSDEPIPVGREEFAKWYQQHFGFVTSGMINEVYRRIPESGTLSNFPTEYRDLSVDMAKKCVMANRDRGERLIIDSAYDKLFKKYEPLANAAREKGINFPASDVKGLYLMNMSSYLPPPEHIAKTLFDTSTAAVPISKTGSQQENFDTATSPRVPRNK